MSTHLRAPTAVLTVLALVSLVIPSTAQTRPFGLGMIGGEPVGATIKVWFNPYVAIALAAGADFGYPSHRPFRYASPPAFQTHLEILGHVPFVRTKALRMPLYVGAGPKFNFRHGLESVRARTPAGLCLLLPRPPFPWEFFVEFAPSWGRRPLVLDPDLAAGIRYYF